uniref:Acyltransferase n=1 Tax=Pristionchus pacificus TaxID=54126 RepID=A0A2A6BB60_PRIPA|eukprot:PDM63113.1 Acyltransferase [Pristionchus pacificus]
MGKNDYNRYYYENQKNNAARYGYAPAPSAPTLEININQNNPGSSISPANGTRRAPSVPPPPPPACGGDYAQVPMSPPKSPDRPPPPPKLKKKHIQPSYNPMWFDRFPRRENRGMFRLCLVEFMLGLVIFAGGVWCLRDTADYCPFHSAIWTSSVYLINAIVGSVAAKSGNPNMYLAHLVLSLISCMMCAVSGILSARNWTLVGTYHHPQVSRDEAFCLMGEHDPSRISYIFSHMDRYDFSKCLWQLKVGVAVNSIQFVIAALENSLKSTANLFDNFLNSSRSLLADIGQIDAQSCLLALNNEFKDFESIAQTLLECGLNASSPACGNIGAAILSDRGLRLLDAWPKLQPGFLTKGPFFLLGDYDECAALGSDTTAPVTPPYDYCRAHLSIDVGSQSVPAVTAGIQAWLDAAGWATRARWSGGPAGDAGWRCTRVGADARTDGALAGVVAVCAALATVVLCGSALDRWRRRQPAPSIALTYRDVPEIRRKLARVGVLTETLCSFSLRSSLAHLFRNAEKDIKCLHAMRILAAVWVVVGHSCLFSLFYMDNARMLKQSLSSPTLSSYFLLASPLAVDTFLFISGAVMSFTYRKRLLFRQALPEATIVHRITRWILFIVHRIFRVYPTILLISFFTLFVFNSLGDGPMWDPEIGVFGTNCTTFGDVAPHLFFVGNIVPSFCLPWLWHLSLDMQIQIFCPLLLIGLTYVPIRARIAACSLTVLIVVYRAVSVYAFSLGGDVINALLAESAFPQSEKLESMFVWFYGNPLSRAAPFLIGALTGWEVSVRSERQLPNQLLVGLKAASAALLLAALITPGHDSFYHTAHLIGAPTAWAAGLALLVWLCENGHCRSLQAILGSHRLLPLSRLAFGVYVTHEQLLLLIVFTARRPATPTSLGYFLLLAMTTFVLSLFVSFFLAMAIEIPPQTLEKRLLKKRKRPCERRPRRPIEEFAPLVPAVSAQDKAALWVSADHDQHAKWAKCKPNFSFFALPQQDGKSYRQAINGSDEVNVDPDEDVLVEDDSVEVIADVHQQAVEDSNC